MIRAWVLGAFIATIIVMWPHSPFEQYDLLCTVGEDTPFTTPGVGAFDIANCVDASGRSYEFILPGGA